MPTENRSSNIEKALTFTESSLASALENVQSLHELGCELIAESVFQQTAEQRQDGHGTYPPCDYCGFTPDYHPWHGSGLLNGIESRHIHACDGCRGKLPVHPGQLQGEPLSAKPALTLQMPDIYDDREGPWFDTAEIRELRKLPAGTKLYLHPPAESSGEVERLRAEIKLLKSDLRIASDTVDLGFKLLAERDALLHEMLDKKHTFMPNLWARIETLLSASEEPSAPVERDERAEFERQVVEKAERFHPDLTQYGDHPDAEYRCASIEWAWSLWQARAALERNP